METKSIKWHTQPGVEFEYPIFSNFEITISENIRDIQLLYLGKNKVYTENPLPVAISSLQLEEVVSHLLPPDVFSENDYGFKYVPWKKFIEYEKKGAHYDVILQGLFDRSCFSLIVSDNKEAGFDRKKIYETITSSFRHAGLRG